MVNNVFMHEYSHIYTYIDIHIYIYALGLRYYSLLTGSMPNYNVHPDALSIPAADGQNLALPVTVNCHSSGYSTLVFCPQSVSGLVSSILEGITH